MVSGRHIKDNTNDKQVTFSFSKIWWTSKVSLLAIGNDCVARSYRLYVPLTCTRAKIRQKVYCGIIRGLEIGLLTNITVWSLLKVAFKTDLLVKTVWKIQWRSWYKMPLKLLGCTGYLYKVVLTYSLWSFSQFSFPFNVRTANALVLKFDTLPPSCLFFNTWLAMFDILFCSRVFHRFVRKNGPKLSCDRVF